MNQCLSSHISQITFRTAALLKILFGYRLWATGYRPLLKTLFGYRLWATGYRPLLITLFGVLWAWLKLFKMAGVGVVENHDGEAAVPVAYMNWFDRSRAKTALTESNISVPDCDDRRQLWPVGSWPRGMVEGKA